ncbi:serine hydrolase [Emticicia sp. BO119]|uniref:serine hydrolase n=1 Tax=Emticicia sp. BO119 TaxID=2757768 RepID=UPI0015F0B22F|nr:serine hydrolase [Emticicia sp. BO119]MBA4853779.1 serine hydrolase [Emticicia sp. BO119]
MKKLKLLLYLSLLLCAFSNARAADISQRIDSLMNALSQRGQFSGSILVAVGGKVIYRNGFGEADREAHIPFRPNTVSCIGSLAKQFTSMAIMLLAEQDKLQFDDPVTKYVPEINTFAEGITIRHLLTHTSGIPDVGDLGIDNPRLNNDLVIKTLQGYKANVAKMFMAPGLKYRYSNTGYMLLDVITERLSGQNRDDFMLQQVFHPLQMADTFVWVGKSSNPKNAALGYTPYGDLNRGVTGGVYSTVDDLFKWENALSTEKLVHKATLDIAYTPYPVKEGTSTYGFGWNITAKDGNQFIWHTGNTGTYRAFIGRMLPERIAVIMLTNKGISKRMEINEAIVNMIHKKPYEMPKISIAEHLDMLIKQEGIDKAIEKYQSYQTNDTKNYDFAESELNSLGYELMSKRKGKEAIRIFELNTIAYPTSSNAFDSLAEAYYNIGNKELAIKYYKKALELDPKNLSSLGMLKKLKP